MSRVIQPIGTRGSLKWIQQVINNSPKAIDAAILPLMTGAKSIWWRSPLRQDDFAEYSDAAFLTLLDLDRFSSDLEMFWPRRGPQWDALGVSDVGDVLLVEAKAHIREMCSLATQASEVSREKIEAALAETAIAFGTHQRVPWSNVFYQLANRLAHLHFLRSRGVKAWLVLVNFIGDEDMRGPKSPSEWEAAFLVALHVMGIPSDASLMRFVVHAYPDVGDLS